MKIKRLTMMLAGMAIMSAAPFAQAEEVVVGVQLPMTGPVASWAGPPIHRGVELAVKQINAQSLLGEGRTMKIILGDNASEKSQAIALATQFANRDKVAMMVGPATSPLAGAAAPVANDAGLPTIALAVSKRVTETGKWIFKIYQDPDVLMTDAAEYIVNTMRPKSATLVFARDNDAFVSYKNLLKAYFEKNGVTDIREESILSSDSDFSALATKIVHRPTDIVYLGVSPESAANIAIQTRQNGLPPSSVFVGNDEMGAPGYVKIGGGAVEGTVYPSFFYADESKPEIDAFIKSYREAYGEAPDQYSAIGYGSMLVAASALKKAGPNAGPDQIREALASTADLPTVLGSGKLSFDEHRNPHYGVVMLKIHDGASVLSK
ncbi:MAG: ABC transporter substrate-binding protein [Candidimonas sp.]